MPSYLVICWNPLIYQTMLNSQPTNCKIHWTLSSTNKTQGVSETYIKDTFFLIIIWCYLILHPKVSLSRKQAFRKYKSISPEDFSDDVVKGSKSINITDTTTDDLVSAYDRSLKSVLDIHAPLKVKSISCRRKVPWFSADLAEAIHKHQKLERIWTEDPENRAKFLQFYKPMMVSPQTCGAKQKDLSFWKPEVR